MISVTKEQYDIFMENKLVKDSISYIHDKVGKTVSTSKAYGNVALPDLGVDELSCVIQYEFGTEYYADQKLYNLTKSEDKV